MVYGHYITDSVGNESFFLEGCTYCRISTGGLHEPDCPMKDKVAEKPRKTPHIRQVNSNSYH